MSREILFRGKRLNNGEWVYGYLARFRNFANEVYTSIIQINDYETQECSIQDNTCVIPETVGQYTGLTDKNGKKIFEGDIVRYGKGIYEWNKKDWEFEVGIIEFKDGAFIINDIYSNDGYNELSCLYHEINCSGKYDSGTLLEVIGNIHDNPELLEVKE